MASSKITFDDLQPHVDMLCDALDNKGASPSGCAYDPDVYQYPDRYRALLKEIRAKNISYESLVHYLQVLGEEVKEAAGDNQYYRIRLIVEALDIYMIKEYNKYVTG